MKRKSLDRGITLGIVAGVWCSMALAGDLYWTAVEERAIQQGNLDGISIETLVDSELTMPMAIAIHRDEGKIYWCDAGVPGNSILDGSIKRSNLDGTDVEDVITGGLIGVQALTIDEEAGKLYFADAPLNSTIMRANLDGSDLEVLSRPMFYILDLALDPEAGYLYFGSSNSLGRMSLDTFTIEILQSGVASAFSIALDPVGEKVYWGEFILRRVRRCNLDGTNPETLFEPDELDFTVPFALAVDLERQKLFISGSLFTTNPLDGPNTIWRSNIDGSQLEKWLASDNVNALGLAIDRESGYLYWSSFLNWWGSPRIERGRIDGVQFETKVQLEPSSSPKRMTVDLADGKMYWSDAGTGAISRANLDGTEAESVATIGHGSLSGLAIDTIERKVYWTDEDAGAIQRSNLDGTVVESLLSNLESPRGMAVNHVAQKMYWTSAPTIATGLVQQANLDGSDIQVLAQDLDNPLGVAVDATHHALYITTGGIPDVLGGKILRHDLLTSQTEVVVSAPTVQLWGALDVAFDANSNRLYWGDIEINKIQSCRTDGSDVRDILTGLAGPAGIAIDAREAGDFDSDGNVTVRDFAAIQNCFTGHESTYSNFGCFFFDVVPRDSFVDQLDFSSFQALMNVP